MARRDSVEVYSYARYFIFTGNVERQVPIIEAQRKVDALVKEMPAAQPGIDLVDTASPYTDDQIQATARGASNGAKYDALCACTSCTGEGVHKVHGTYKQLGYKSQSEADHALLSIIAFYTPSNEQVRRLFRCTGLGKRDKAIKNNKYLNMSLRKIRANRSSKWRSRNGCGEVARKDGSYAAPACYRPQ
jgi:primase-polymerase (primpol)-like protein